VADRVIKYWSQLFSDCLPVETPSIDEMEIFELLNPETRGKRWGDWRLIFIAERSGLLRRLERHCRRAEIRAVVTAARAMPIFVVKSAQ